MLRKRVDLSPECGEIDPRGIILVNVNIITIVVIAAAAVGVGAGDGVVL